MTHVLSAWEYIWDRWVNFLTGMLLLIFSIVALAFTLGRALISNQLWVIQASWISNSVVFLLAIHLVIGTNKRGLIFIWLLGFTVVVLLVVLYFARAIPFEAMVLLNTAITLEAITAFILGVILGFMHWLTRTQIEEINP